jgi:heat shock protein HtpX
MFEWAGQDDSVKPGRLQRYYRTFIERRDQQLIEQLKQSESLRPTFTLPKLAAILFAIPIHLVTFALPLLGIALILSQLGGFVPVCCGLTLLGVAWLVRPRFGKAPEDVVTRAKFPALYQAADEVAAALKAAPVDTIAINEHFNAAYGRFGLRRSRLIILGYPLWLALDDQERVALLAHELAHDVNGDFSRSFFVGSAIDTLFQWYLLAAPMPRVAPVYDMMADTAQGLTNVVMSFVAEALLVVIFFMGQLLIYESRRAEYLADYLSAQVAGTDAVVSMLEKHKGRDAGFVPLQFRTHPPTEYRLEFLKAKPRLSPHLHLSPATIAQIGSELATLEREMNRRIEQRRNEGRYY